MKTLGFLFLAACLTVGLAGAPALAKTQPSSKNLPAAPSSSSGGGGPIDISAEESLEWYQNQRLYVARGQARAVRGDTVVEAEILTAHQRETEKGTGASGAMGDIDLLIAEGRVRISDPKQQVFGEKAVYDLDRKTVKITGPNLKYMTEKDVVTARDSLEYHEDKNIAVARGRAVAEHQESRIEADVLTAYFTSRAVGPMEMEKITAKGNVMILTKDGSLSRGERGVYDVRKDKAYLMEHVRITRGETQLAGDRAEVDFATGQSKLLNDGSGRVRALLPSSSGKEAKP